MNYKINYKVNNIHTSPELSCVTLDGEIGARFDRFVYERITSKFALDYIWKEAEEVFADKYDDEYAAGMWRGEFWGKLILSAVRVCRMSGDASLKAEIRESAYRMLSYQTDEGVISTYRDGDDIFPPASADAVKDMGWDCTYNWNIWGQKYTLWAMLECAQLLDDQCILNCCARMADHIIEQLDRLGVRLKDTGTALMVGMPPCSIMKPMLVLYRLTGKQSYLDFCLGVAKDWMREDNELPNLINNARSDVAPSKWYDGWYAKAYEMMSCFDGLVELYRVTGDCVYFDAVKGIWELLTKYELNILGSVGYCERFLDAASQFDSATEVCDAIHWMRICHELFMLTGEAKYMEAFERAFLNAFLAGIYEDGKTGAFFVRGAGRHWTAEPQVETKYQHCCVNNAARTFVNTAESLVTVCDGNYYINSYVPTRVKFGDTSIRISSGYTDKGLVNVIVRGIVPGTKLYFRIPEWSKTSSVKCGDSDYKTECGKYAEVVSDSAEMHFIIRFDMTPRFYDYQGEFVDYPDNDYHRMRWCDSNKGLCDRKQMLYAPKSVLYRGPVLLARSKRIGNTEEEMFGDYTVYGKEKTASAQFIRHDNMLCACRVNVTVDGETKEYVMCDYASAANRDLEDVRFFSVYM